MTAEQLAILTATRLAAELLLSLVDRETAGRALDDAAVRRANAVADVAESLKWPGERR
jgi:hypothetical protein